MSTFVSGSESEANGALLTLGIIRNGFSLIFVASYLKTVSLFYLYSTFNNNLRFKASWENALTASTLSSSSIGSLHNANEYSVAYGLSDVKAGGKVARRVDGTV